MLNDPVHFLLVVKDSNYLQHFNVINDEEDNSHRSLYLLILGRRSWGKYIHVNSREVTLFKAENIS